MIKKSNLFSLLISCFLKFAKYCRPILAEMFYRNVSWPKCFISGYFYSTGAGEHRDILYLNRHLNTVICDTPCVDTDLSGVGYCSEVIRI